MIWNAVEVEVKPGQRVIVTNLRLKKSNNGERELHGDSGSIVKVVGEGREFPRSEACQGQPGEEPSSEDTAWRSWRSRFRRSVMSS